MYSNLQRDDEIALLVIVELDKQCHLPLPLQSTTPAFSVYLWAAWLVPTHTERMILFLSFWFTYLYL